MNSNDAGSNGNGTKVKIVKLDADNTIIINSKKPNVKGISLGVMVRLLTDLNQRLSVIESDFFRSTKNTQKNTLEKQ